MTLRRRFNPLTNIALALATAFGLSAPTHAQSTRKAIWNPANDGKACAQAVFWWVGPGGYNNGSIQSKLVGPSDSQTTVPYNGNDLTVAVMSIGPRAGYMPGTQLGYTCANTPPNTTWEQRLKSGLSGWGGWDATHDHFAQVDPTQADSDNDGISNIMEVQWYHSNPNNPDTDGDGLRDGEEEALFKMFGPDACVYDADGDGLFCTSDADSDGDGVSDRDEIFTNRSPLTPGM